MNQQKFRLPLAMVLVLTAGSAFAAEAEQDPHHPGTTPTATAAPGPGFHGMPMGLMMGSSEGMPTMGMMQMMTGQDGIARHVEGRIAFLRAELKITDAQQPLWSAVADAMRANAKTMPGMAAGMPMMGSATTLPDKLATHEKMMTTHLDNLRRLEAAVEPLYAALNAEQKKTADELMVGPLGMIGMGMM